MASSSPALAEALAASGRMSVYEQFHERARHAPDAIALRSARRCDTYGALDARVRRAAAMLQARGLARGDRVALLSENCCEYIEIELAAALLGLIVACQNWRLARDELRHCIALVEPGLVIASARFRAAYDATGLDVPAMTIETDYAQALAASAPLAGRPVVDPEDGLVILYTSGTTGLPKGALISHRAQVARAAVLCMDYGITREDGFVAWAPMFHMASTDQMLQALMSGATVHVIDGYEPRALVDIMSRFRIGWMVLMPGSIGQSWRSFAPSAPPLPASA
ncbi:MAG: AMP-binding protein [Burkholderiaceae bacterium]